MPRYTTLIKRWLFTSRSAGRIVEKAMTPSPYRSGWSRSGGSLGRVWVFAIFVAGLGCGESGGRGNGEATGVSGPSSCTPGEQRACACPGDQPDGVQVCSDAGDRFGECTGCQSEATGTTADPPGSSTSSGGGESATQSTSTSTDASAEGSTSPIPDVPIPGDGIPDDPPQAIPPAPPPDGYSVVQEVAAEFPELLTGSCVEAGGNNEFLFEVVRRLRALDDRWGLNWKRGVVGDMSQDVIDYHYAEGLSEGSTDVYIIDVIGSHCGDPQAAWTDVTQATADAGTVGTWTLAGQEL